MRFDQPIGNQFERDSQAWAGGWYDANPFGSYYTNPATGLAAYHTGADLNMSGDADAHSPVYASADGVVVFAGALSVWGNVIVIKHATDGVWTRYAHVEGMTVKAGDLAWRGVQIARVGNANGTMAYHMHFDVARVDLGAKPGDWPGTDKARLLRDYVDPKQWINTHRGTNTQMARGTPRIQYGRTYNALHPSITVEQGKQILERVWADGQTVGRSFDDAGVGDLDTRVARLWGIPESEKASYTSFYGTYYPGVKVVFESLTTPKPPDPPTPQPQAFKLGVSVLNSHNLLEPAYQAGVRCFLIMNGLVTAKSFKTAHPDAIVMYRRFVDHGGGIPDPKLFAAEAGIGGGVVFVSPLNECDRWCYGTPAEIEARAKFDNQLADMCNASGTIYAAGGFSMGTPDFTKPEICEAMRKFYAPGYNARKYAMNWHTYSPTMGWIYGQQKAVHITGLNSLRADGVVEIRVGRDGHIATYNPNGRYGVAALANADPIGQRIWFERRWEFAFDSCGFDPSPNLLGIYSDETGVDEGGVGGFPAHGAGDAEIEKWAREYCALQRLPLNGGQSVMRGAAIFQAGDTGQWNGYNVQGNFAAIVRGNQ